MSEPVDAMWQRQSWMPTVSIFPDGSCVIDCNLNGRIRLNNGDRSRLSEFLSDAHLTGCTRNGSACGSYQPMGCSEDEQGPVDPGSCYVCGMSKQAHEEVT